MNFIKKGLITLGTTAALAGVFTVTASTDAEAATWEARTVSEVVEDIEQKETSSQYRIQWGDTLGVIARAFEVPLNEITKINEIANKDFIMTGNVLSLSADHNTVSVQNSQTNEVKSYDISEPEVKEVEVPEEVEREAAEKQAAKKAEKETPAPAASGRNLGQFQATAYTAYDGTQIGITRGGTNMANGNIHTASGHRIIAADPSVIPFGSIVRITLSSGEVINGKVDDTGGAINGNIIDLSFASKAEAFAFGRQNVTVEIIN